MYVVVEIDINIFSSIISAMSRKVLSPGGGYNSEMRGQVEVKGKGFMDTYWLLSRNA